MSEKFDFDNYPFLKRLEAHLDCGGSKGEGVNRDTHRAFSYLIGIIRNLSYKLKGRGIGCAVGFTEDACDHLKKIYPDVAEEFKRQEEMRKDAKADEEVHLKLQRALDPTKEKWRHVKEHGYWDSKKHSCGFCDEFKEGKTCAESGCRLYEFVGENCEGLEYVVEDRTYTVYEVHLKTKGDTEGMPKRHAMLFATMFLDDLDKWF